MKKIKKIAINELIKGYELDSISHTKNAPSNTILINMLENSNLEFLSVEINRGGVIHNRGSVIECLVRACINEYVKGSTSNHYKKQCKGFDLSTKNKSAIMLFDLGLFSGMNYEIKSISSLARASYSNKEQGDFIIMVDIRAKSKGVYLVEYSDLIFYNETSIKGYKQGKRLELLEELLGL